MKKLYEIPKYQSVMLFFQKYYNNALKFYYFFTLLIYGIY